MQASHAIAPYQLRRQSLIDAIRSEGGGLVFIPTAHSSEGLALTPFRPDPDFYYLTQFTEADAALVISVESDSVQSTLFCLPKDPAREIWDGLRFGPEAAQTVFGFDRALPIEALAAYMQTHLARCARFYYPIDVRVSAMVAPWLAHVAQQGRSGIKGPLTHIDSSQMVAAMRQIKDSHEQQLMQRAADISAKGHIRVMQKTQPGLKEYQLDAELWHVFRSEGASAPAYSNIVGTGANSCILHYRAGAQEIAPGDMILVDAGCEYQGYAGDITRSFPASGRFNPTQAAVYECVLTAQLAAIAAAKVGARFDAPHQAALQVLAQGLLDLGLLSPAQYGNAAAVIESKAYQRFFMHRTSHWLGLDVHDVGSYIEADGSPRLLQPGMVLTIEPGLYIQAAADIAPEFWNIGVRIEDDILVTEGVPHVLSALAPKAIRDIEETMAG